ncbi:MAG: nucleotidyltransferase substrate binding protein [Cyanobacteria bacterium J06627_28]
MTDLDIRWKQRFDSYQKALAMLTKFIDKGELNELEEQGFIQAFEYTHELAWKLLKAFLEDQNPQAKLYGSRDVTRKAFNLGLIDEGHMWMDMIKDRNQTSHTYNKEIAQKISGDVRTKFFDKFVALEAKMKTMKNDHG